MTKNKNILLLAHITMGYGSPELLNLYHMLTGRGFNVVISDQQDPHRKYYPLEGVNRLFRENLKGKSAGEINQHQQKILQFIDDFQPSCTITSFSRFLTDPKFPLNTNKGVRVLYAAEIIKDASVGNFDYLIAPNEDRIEIISRSTDNKKAFLIYNAPLLGKRSGSKTPNFENPDILNILYQGQISTEAGCGVLLAALRNSDGVFLHLCGEIRDSRLKNVIKRLQSENKLFYYGFLKQDELERIRNVCHVGYIGWREDLDPANDSIRYCCPTKLYDYIAHGLPVVFLKNETLDKWNNIYGFGYSTGSYDDAGKLSEIFQSLLKTTGSLKAFSRHLISLYETQLNYDFQCSPFVNELSSRLGC